MIDFGNASRCTLGHRRMGYQGTKGWTAPEISEDEEWDPFSADVWAIAKTLLYFAKVDRL